MSTKIWFKYIVQSGDNTSDLDYVSTNSLTLSAGSSIKCCEAGNDATLTLPTPSSSGSLGSNKNIVISAGTPSISATSNTSLPNIEANISGEVVSNGSFITYTENESTINNPERGIYRYTQQSANYSSAVGSNNLSVATLNGYKSSTEKSNLVYRYYLVPEFISSDFNTTFLNNIQTDFDNMRTAGFKCMFRISYANAYLSEGEIGSEPEQQPSKAQILTHISQLAPLINANKDVIHSYQAGYIGTWGEWYYTFSSEFGHKGSIDSTQLANRQEVLEAMVDSTPLEVALQMRYPAQKRSMYGTTGLTSATAYQNTYVARLGFFNDAAFNNWGDQGFYSVGGECTSPVSGTIWNYVANETQYTLMTGENNGLNPCSSGARTLPSNVLSEMDGVNWSSINRDYHPDFWAQWNGTDYETLIKRLGYRYVLENLDVEVVNDSDINLTINLRNEGFSRLVKDRPSYIVLKNISTSAIGYFPLNSDPRTWDGSVTINQTLSTNLSGDFKLYLWLPDKNTTVTNNPDYAIQIANTGVWESFTGYNDLSATVELSGTGNVISGNINLNFPNLDTSIYSNNILNGSSSTSLQNLDISSNGTVRRTASSSISLQNLDTSISGKRFETGSSNISLQNLDTSSNGTVRRTASSSISLQNLDVSISGNIVSPTILTSASSPIKSQETGRTVNASAGGLSGASQINLIDVNNTLNPSFVVTSDNTLTYTVPQVPPSGQTPSLLFGNIDIQVDDSTTLNIELNPDDNHNYVVITSVSASSVGSVLGEEYWETDPIVGDYIYYPKQTDEGGTLTINSDGTFTITGSSAETQTFRVRIGDQSDSIWGTEKTFTVGVNVVNVSFQGIQTSTSGNVGHPLILTSASTPIKSEETNRIINASAGGLSGTSQINLIDANNTLNPSFVVTNDNILTYTVPQVPPNNQSPSLLFGNIDIQVDSSNTLNIELNPDDNHNYVVITSVSANSVMSVLGSEYWSPEPIVGDYIYYPKQTDEGSNLTINSDGTFIISGGDIEQQTFRVRIGDQSDSTWGTEKTFIVGVNVVEPIFKNLDVSISGKRLETGSSNISLRKLNVSSNGTIRHTASSSISLRNLDTSISGKKIVTGYSSISLRNLDTSISGNVKHVGSSNISLQNLDVSISGKRFETGSSNISLRKLNVSSNGTVRHVASSSVSLRNLDTSISGKKIVNGSSNISLRNLNTNISSNVRHIGSSNISLQNLDISSNGTVRHTASSSISLQNLDTSISGKRILTGSSNISLQNLNVVVGGAVGSDVFVNITLPNIETNVSGKRILTGSSNISLQNLNTSISGKRLGIGSSNISLQNLNVSSNGKRILTVSSNTSLRNLDISISGTVRHLSTGNITLPNLETNVSGKRILTGSSNISLQNLNVSSNGTVRHAISSNISLQNLNVSSNGKRILSGSSNISLQNLNTSISGTVEHDFGSQLEANVNISLQNLNVSSNGKRLLTGSSNISLRNLDTSISGKRILTGSSNISLQNLNISSNSITSHNISGSISLRNLDTSISGAVRHIASSNISLQNLNISSNVNVIFPGNSNISLPNLDVSISGKRILTGSSNISLQNVNISSDGTVEHITSSNISLQNLNVSSNGNRFETGSSDIFLQNLNVSIDGNVLSGERISVELQNLNITSIGNIIRLGSVNIEFPRLETRNTFVALTSGTTDIQFNSIELYSVGSVQEKQEDVFPLGDCLPNDYFHFFADNGYNNESSLYDSLLCENYNIYGTDCLYYTTTFDTNYDKLFGEDDNRRILRKFPVKVSFELPREMEAYSKFGIEGMDNFQMYVSKNHFRSASKLHIDAKLFPQVPEVLKNINPSERPNVGDIIYSQYNNMYFEVLDVGEEDEMFLQRKHTWTLTVRMAKNEHLTLDTTNANSMQDINEELISKEDITRLNEYISSAADNVFYTSSTGESTDTTNPLNGW